MISSGLPEPALLEGIPPRSRLIGHVPAGVGSGRCEGLIGYLVQLARAHHVNPRELARTELLPHCQRTGGMQYANFFSDYARTIHGVGPYAEDFLQVVERLTGRRDLRPMTLLPWQAVIPVNSAGFLAREVRWCRHCLLEARVARECRPFPLVWSLGAYQVCGTHRTPLVSRCPSCGNAQPFIPYLPDQSHCSHCGQWLGFGWEEDGVAPTADGAVWASLALENLVAFGPHLGNEALSAAWRRCCIRLIGQYGKGAKKVASRALGLTPTAFNTWLVKGQKPSFPQLLQLCQRLDQMPAELLGVGQAADDCASLIRKVETPDIPFTKCIFREEGLQTIRRRLEAIVADAEDCRPMVDVCREVGVSRGFMAYRFRDLCRRQSEKHRQWRMAEVADRRRKEHQVVQEVVQKIAQEGVYPARRRIERALRSFGLSLVREDLRLVYRQAVENSRGLS